MKPLVSVIVPTYNRKELLKETLESVLAQTFKNFELIVVDNFSNYDFFASINSLNDSRIRGFQNQNHGIIAVNRNFGMKQAQGKYIALCDDDDLWLPEKLEKQLEIFEKNKDILLVSTNASIFPNIKSNSLGLFSNKILSFDFVLSAPFSFSTQSKIITSSVLFKAEIIQKIALLDEDRNLITVEDYDYWLRILNFRDKSIFVIKNDLVRYRVHISNASKFDDSKPTLFDRLKIIYKKYSKTEYLVNRLDYEKSVLIVKMAYYEGQLNFFNLMSQKINFTDKIIIFIKKIFKNYL